MKICGWVVLVESGGQASVEVRFKAFDRAYDGDVRAGNCVRGTGAWRGPSVVAESVWPCEYVWRYEVERSSVWSYIWTYPIVQTTATAIYHTRHTAAATNATDECSSLDRGNSESVGGSSGSIDLSFTKPGVTLQISSIIFEVPNPAVHVPTRHTFGANFCRFGKHINKTLLPAVWDIVIPTSIHHALEQSVASLVAAHSVFGDSLNAMMQSSPPTRATQRPASPTDSSQYSVNLAALDLDSRSNASATPPLPAQYVDKVLSEDIDGPTDFTLNMEKWMRGRGDPKGKGTVRSAKSGLRSVQEREDEARAVQEAQNVTGGGENGGLSTPRKEAQDEHSASHHTPNTSPPKESVFDGPSQHENDVNDSSDWDPYGEASTPQPPVHKQFLQPTVEDYHSELTLAHPPSARAPPAVSKEGGVGVAETVSQEKLPIKTEEPFFPGRPSSETLSPTRSSVFQPSAPLGQNPTPETSEAAHFSVHLNDLRAKCTQLERSNAALSKAVDEERRMRAEEREVHEAKLAEAARRERDLVEMKDRAYAHKENFRREFAELKEKLREREGVQGGWEEERLKREHEGDMEGMRVRMERQKGDSDQEIRALERDLELVRRSRDDAEEDARTAREELDRWRDGQDAEFDRLRFELGDDGEGARERVAELEENLKAAQLEKEKLLAARNAAEDNASALRMELAETKRAQTAEMTKVTVDRHSAVKLAEDLQAELKKLRRQLQEQHVTHTAEISRLQLSHDQDSPSAELDTLRAEVDAKQSSLNTAILERDALQDSLESTSSRLRTAEQALVDLDEVNATLDARVSDAIRRRETYWRGRVGELERERVVMARALMRGWGREECGVELPEREGDGQVFEYKFLKGKG